MFNKPKVGERVGKKCLWCMENLALEKIVKDVEQTLLALGDRLISYTIGKTHDPNDRECYYQNKRYTHFCEICKGTPDEINQGEKYLIAYFDTHSILKDKKDNERGGGGGNPNADILYIAIRNKEKHINDIDGNILPQEYPIELK